MDLRSSIAARFHTRLDDLVMFHCTTLQGINISHLRKFGKSSSKVPAGICVSSLEGIKLVDNGILISWDFFESAYHYR